MRKALILTSALLALTIPRTALPQVPNQALALKIADARKANAAKLRQYSWESRVELLENATVLDIRIYSVAYGPGSQLQRTLLNNESAPLPHGFIRKRIAEKKREKVEKYLKGLTEVLDQYTLPTAGKVLDFVSHATVSAPDASGLLKLSGNNVVVPGDVLTIWVDAATRETRKMQLTTTFEDDFVQANVSFKTLRGGPTHLAFATVTVAAKNLTLQVHNYDYNSNN
jgi:hypothetical protein